jgi:large subunit ribosomal protein L28
MSAHCDVCGKGPGFGKSVSRLGKNALKRRVFKRADRRFDPNIQKVRAMVNGTPKRMNVCVRCLKADKVVRAARS